MRRWRIIRPVQRAERSERKPAASDIPASARKIRGINADKPEMKTVSFDEMWTRMRARRGKKRRSARIWTAVDEWDGSRRADFDVGCRDAETLRRLLHRLPKAAKYRSGHCEAYSVPPSDATHAALSALGSSASRSSNERAAAMGASQTVAKTRRELREWQRENATARAIEGAVGAALGAASSQNQN